MAVNIKKIISDVVEKIKGNPSLLANFKSKPAETVKSLVDVDLPDDQMKVITEQVKSKIEGKADASSVISTVKGLFKK